MTELEAFLSQFNTETVSVALCDLETGREYYRLADLSLPPASTFKVAVMIECFHQAELGLISLDQAVPVVNAFRSIADGSIYSNDPTDDADSTLYEKLGQTERLGEMMRLMIVRSSNLATNILIPVVGAAAVTAYLVELGIQDVRVLRGVEDYKAYALGMNNSVTARGLMQMMRAIADGRAVSARSSREMTEILLAQEFNEGIPAGLPAGAKVAHKTGWIEKIYHDYGIIYPGGRRPYVLAVMTAGFEETAAHACVREVSRLIHEQLSL